MAAFWLFHLLIGLVVALEYRGDTDAAINHINHDTTKAAVGLMDNSYPPPLHQPISNHSLLTTGISSNSGRSRRYKRQTGCATNPASPANGRMQCSAYSGCRAKCSRGFQFPTGEKRLFLECDEKVGQWKVAGDLWETLPDCLPVCRPPCQNNGNCWSPNVCECPDNWEGPTCEVPKKKECRNKPPTPKNSRIFCSTDDCMAKCYKDYTFPEGITRLIFECQEGEWIIKNSQWTTIPDCEETPTTETPATKTPTTETPTTETPTTETPTTEIPTKTPTTIPTTSTTPKTTATTTLISTSTTAIRTTAPPTTLTTTPRTTIKEATTSSLPEGGKTSSSGTHEKYSSSESCSSYQDFLVASEVAATLDMSLHLIMLL